MSEQPNEEESQEVTEAKSDSNSKTNWTALAAIFMAIAIICGLVGTWAAATYHYTTLTVAIIVGIVSVGLATWLGWPPKQIRRRTSGLLKKIATVLLHSSKPPTLDDPSIPPDKPSEARIIQAEYDRLAQERVRDKFELERLRKEIAKTYETTRLQHDDSVDEIPTEKLTEENQAASLSKEPEDTKDFFPPEKPQGGHVKQDGPGWIPFDVGPPGWLKYTEDKLFNIVWRWHYTPEFDNEPEPHGVTPFCPECGREIGGYRYTDGRTGGFAVHIECKFHPSINYDCGYDDYAHIRKLIRQKIDDGSYDEVVTRLRMNRPGWYSN